MAEFTHTEIDAALERGWTARLHEPRDCGGQGYNAAGRRIKHDHVCVAKIQP